MSKPEFREIMFRPSSVAGLGTLSKRQHIGDRLFHQWNFDFRTHHLF